MNTDDLFFPNKFYQIQDEARLREVLKYANACGAITTTKKGAIPALPTDAEVLKLINGA